MSDREARKNALKKAARLAIGGNPGGEKSHPIGGRGPEQITVHCPFCGRGEEIGGRLLGQAWLTGHLSAEHRDELPAFEGLGDE